jgi:hypothetical protein
MAVIGRGSASIASVWWIAAALTKAVDIDHFAETLRVHGVLPWMSSAAWLVVAVEGLIGVMIAWNIAGRPGAREAGVLIVSLMLLAGSRCTP